MPDDVTMPGTPWLNLDEAAAYLRVSPSWLEKSDCPRALLGRRRVYHRATLDEYALARMSHAVGAARGRAA